MGRIANLKESQVLSGSALLKSGPGTLHSVTITWTGATAGDKVYFRDGLAASAAKLVPIVLSAATGTLQLNWANGKAFTTGLFYDEEIAAAIEMTCSYV